MSGKMSDQDIMPENIVTSGGYAGEDEVRASTEKCWIRVSTEKKGGIPASAEKVESGRVLEMWDPGEYREGNIRVSTRKGRIQASTGNVGSGRVPGR